MSKIKSNILKLVSITKKYEDFFASNNVNFSVRKGEFVTLLGPSGCGKTTLLKMIGGFIEPTSGQIIINDQDVTKVPPEKRETAMCFQSYALFPHLSVSHNICFGLVQQKVPMHEQEERLEQILQQVGLIEHKDKLPNELSGGQQQRVALARAMITRPDIILFDEPLSNLDAKMREGVRFEIKELQRKYQLTSIYVTHDQAEALALSDRIVVLNSGKIEQIGTPEDIYFRPKNRFVADFIGAANIHKAFVSPNGNSAYNISCNLGDLDVQSDENPESDNIYISWRPEDAQVCEKGTPNSFELVVDSVAFQGEKVDVFGWVGPNRDQKVRLLLDGRQTIELNTVLYIFVPSHCIRFLEKV
ncbi:ABC transporter ATP-binding protein [Vibrio sp. S12_S33]|uniref:ABC transporter ATP-binding protein n=1 Tax=Vibrio sp. S12_S33 TaxID=2720223 RepID=UPI001781110E|nr:ABC transporter ATP-binding protein [Vibrio sp. S12_S33]MBD1566332.1 ABC transporter ATP-binding protein [Vibrio sp. S12_S33]